MKHNKQVALALAAGVTTLTGASPAFAAPAPSAESLLPIDTGSRPDFAFGDGSAPIAQPVDDIDALAKSRAFYGLSDDRTLVTALSKQTPVVGGTTSADGTVDWSEHYPVRREELPQLRRQLKIDSALRVAVNSGSIAKAVGPAYSGVWIDHKAGATITIAATTPVDLNAVRSLFPAGTEIRTKKVDYTYDELQTALDQITQRWAANKGVLDGVKVNGLSINEQLNTIVLFTSTTSRDLGSVVKLGLQRQLATVLKADGSRPLPIRIKFGEPESTSTVNSINADPKMGGQYIWLSGGDGYAGCTTAFRGYTNDTHQYGIFSAGHCKWPGGGSVGYQGGSGWSGAFQGWSTTADHNLWLPNAYANSDTMFINNASGAQSKVFIGSGKALNVVGWWGPSVPDGNPYPGCGQAMSMMLGHRYYNGQQGLVQNVPVSCDEINVTRLDNNTTRDGQAFPIMKHQINIHYCVIPGDSGSPLFTADSGNLYAVGTLSWRSTAPFTTDNCSFPEPNAWFTSVWYGAQTLGVTLG